MKKTVKIQKIVRLHISRFDIIEAFSDIPNNAELVVRVPSGGNYSGDEIDLPEIVARWTEQSEEEI